MICARFTQHFNGIGQNESYANFQYILIPKEDRITYTSLYQLVFNAGNLALATFEFWMEKNTTHGKM
ncbi:MAG TPA: hypothetical protein PK778_04235 [Bacillota bacterium]|nr:hypothetical protein [Bacillota bacterium]